MDLHCKECGGFIDIRRIHRCTANSRQEAQRLERKELSEQLNKLTSKQKRDFVDWFNAEIVDET
jgi:hypothetical protein